MSKKMIRIGNAGGYWGDDPAALKRQVEKGPMDYISMDFLAEITMSILQKQRAKDANLGYAHDFVPMVTEVLETIMSKNITIIANSGGVNPNACATKLWDEAKQKGFDPRIAIVRGDDIMHALDDLVSKGVAFKNMENGQEFADVRHQIESANIYFGATAVVEALKWNPNIVVTGRVTDTGITLAPMMHEFAWKADEWDKLASGIVAGHMMECGSQSTGGNFTDWHLVDSYDEMGFPICEMHEDGSFIITKHEGTGGLVSVDTVREQLFYEMGRPDAYITPDVIADFSTIELESDGPNRVRVSGVRGYAPTDSYKVSMAYQDGFKAVGSIMISGPRARAKAEKFAQNFWNKIDVNVEAKETEYVGWNSCQRSLGHQDDGQEIMLRLGARSHDAKDLRRWGKWIPSLILSGPPGVCVMGGVPRAQNVVSYWPALMPKDLVFPVIGLFEKGQVSEEREVKDIPTGDFVAGDTEVQIAKDATLPIEKMISENKDEVELEKICLARSGDKGDMCNVGVIARSPEAFAFLEKHLTAETVKNYFQELCYGTVTRYKVEKLQGFNFLLDSALGGGGTMTLRTDAQGKMFAQALLRQKVKIPADVLNSVK